MPRTISIIGKMSGGNLQILFINRKIVPDRTEYCLNLEELSLIQAGLQYYDDYIEGNKNHLAYYSHLARCNSCQAKLNEVSQLNFPSNTWLRFLNLYLLTKFNKELHKSWQIAEVFEMEVNRF